MALRVSIPTAMLAAGIESLFVLGVAATTDTEGAASALASLLDAHHYTDGLEFLRQGHPDQQHGPTAAPATTRRILGLRTSFAVEVLSDPAALDATSNGARPARRLASPQSRSRRPSVAPARARNARRLDARSMNTALWPVAWGYFLPNLIGFDGTGLYA